MAEILAAGTTELASSPFSVAAGETTTLYLKVTSANAVMPHDARAVLQLQEAGGAWQSLRQLDISNPAAVLTAVGTFRVVRQACSSAVGVDRN